MAGIDTLVKGAVGALAKDKVSPFLSPSQRDFLALILSPQGYLLDKGVSAAANALGYGSQYRELKEGAEDDKEYYKEVMRDTLGNALPDSIGDFVRATPRVSEADQAPAGVYYDSDTGGWTPSANPVVSSDPFTGDRFGGKYDQDSVYNTNSQNYVGPAYPKDMDSSIYSSNLTDLLSMLDEYRTAEVPETVITASKETTPTTETLSPIDFGGTMDYSDIFGGGGSGGRELEREIDFGNFWDGGGGWDYKRGGAIPKSNQACGCK